MPDDAADDHEADDADTPDAHGDDDSSLEPSTSPERPQRQNVNATGLVATLPDGTRLPGARATFVALVLAILGFSYAVLYPQVQIDERGERVPLEFQGLYLEARSCLEALNEGLDCLGGEPVETETVTFIEADGMGVVLFLFVPLAVTAFAWYTHRKTGLSRPLTFGMLALAFAVLFTGQFFMPALIALAVGAFQARKAEMPARLAERAAGKPEDEKEDDDKGDG